MGALAFAVIRACNVPNLEKQATTAAYGVTKIARGANAAARDSNADMGDANAAAFSTFRVVCLFLKIRSGAHQGSPGIPARDARLDKVPYD